METYQGIESATGVALNGNFELTTVDQVDGVMRKAQEAYLAYQATSLADRAKFLVACAEEIEALGDELVERAMQETGLPQGRIIGERGRTMNQLRLFATVAEKGEWVEAAIDTADPNRTPAPKPDLRKQLEPLGPVIVFGASNFPLAYSAAGGDTASALAAGCAVVVKAHPAHPGSSQLVANAIQKAAERTGMPSNIYQHVHDAGFEIGQALVKHPLTTAVGFTGSFKGGKALFDIAAQREVPIPVFAEMGSINPVVLFPNELENNAGEWGANYAKSITLGCGQFCTNPGLVVGLKSEALDRFQQALLNGIQQEPSQQMLHDGISEAYNAGKGDVEQNEDLTVYYNKNEDNARLGGPCLAKTTGAKFIANKRLHAEIFGPYSLLVECSSEEELLEVLGSIEGQLTGTAIASDADIDAYSLHLNTLKSKVGRLIFNGVPTGVEVCTAMNHGGPFPATTDGRFTAVGADAIKRFARPVSYQSSPESFLPDALKNENVLGIYRRINGELTNGNV